MAKDSMVPAKLIGPQIFSINISSLMPDRKLIPDDIKNERDPWCDVVNQWFFSGLSKSLLVAKPGIDKDDALLHLATILRSWEPKHEHKTEAVAYLLSLWFEPVKK